MPTLDHQLTWSVRDFGADTLESDQLLVDLGGFCRRACSSEFRHEDGYCVGFRRLSGALDGESILITRGGFRGLVSVQRFCRHDVTGGRISEVRVVASARHEPWALVAHKARRGQWGVAAGAAGVVGIGVAALQIVGVLSTWAQLLALVPALMAWRILMAQQIAIELRRDSMCPALSEALGPGDAESHNDDLDRWHRVVRVVAAQRDAVVERFQSRGFRTQGALPGTVASLTPPPVAHLAPPRTLPVPDLALPPLGRTTAL